MMLSVSSLVRIFTEASPKIFSAFSEGFFEVAAKIFFLVLIGGRIAEGLGLGATAHHFAIGGGCRGVPPTKVFLIDFKNELLGLKELCLEFTDLGEESAEVLVYPPGEEGLVAFVKRGQQGFSGIEVTQRLLIIALGLSSEGCAIDGYHGPGIGGGTLDAGYCGRSRFPGFGARSGAGFHRRESGSGR